MNTTSRYLGAGTFTVNDPRRGHVEGVGLIYTPAAIANFRPYQVEAGDRWDTIADQFLGDPALWWRVADMNPELFDPRALRSGIIIRVPLQ